MNDFKTSPDDPKLTAFALGELEGEELAAFEAAVQRDPALRASVEEIRTTAGHLESALAAEAEVLDAVAVSASESVRPARVEFDEYRRPPAGPVGRMFRFPNVYYVLSGTAAACFAVMFALREAPPTRISPEAKPQYVTIEVPLVPLVKSEPEKPAGEKSVVGIPPGDRPAWETSVAAIAPSASGAELPAPPSSAPVLAPPPEKPDADKSFAVNAPLTPTALEPTEVAKSAPDPIAPKQAETIVATADAVPTNRADPAPVPPSSPPPASVVQKPAPVNTDKNEVVPIESLAPSTDGSVNYATQLRGSGPRQTANGKAFRPPPPPGARLARTAAELGPVLDNEFQHAEDNPKSSFPIAVEASSYGEVRRALEAGRLPSREMVRIEELLNHFPYRYDDPRDKVDSTFATTMEVADAPWAPTHRLVRIGVKARDSAGADRLAIAKDVKIEVEFNPAKVSSYRLIGFENPRLRKEDFNPDLIDHVQISAGHAMTALYEVVPVGADDARGAAKAGDDSPYRRIAVVSSRLEMPSKNVVLDKELLVLTVHYTKPGGLIGFRSRKPTFSLIDSGRGFAEASADFKFAAAVAEFGMILRDSPHKGSGTIGNVLTWAAAGATNAADDPRGYRSEFIQLAQRAQALMR
ncbi:MAG: von Willebrand factor type A domain-containing protein [Opitutaceae bacterium]